MAATVDRVKMGACRINVLEAGNFSAVDRLTFWAQGEQGGAGVEFRIGALAGSPALGRSVRVELEPSWQQYEIDLKGMDLTQAVDLFDVFIADVNNPQGVVFYLDDIQFEGVR